MSDDVECSLQNHKNTLLDNLEDDEEVSRSADENGELSESTPSQISMSTTMPDELSNENVVDINLETPLVDDNISHISEKGDNSVKPKRLSDEFFSADDDCDEDEVGEGSSENVVASCSGSSKTSPEMRLGDDFDNISEPLSEETSSCSSLGSSALGFNHSVQLMDAIERRDFEIEQKLTGGIIIKSSSLLTDTNRLNLGLINKHKPNGAGEADDDLDEEATSSASSQSKLTSTPTSSRYNIVNKPSKKSTIKSSSAKVNLSVNIEKYVNMGSTSSEPVSEDPLDKILNSNESGAVVHVIQHTSEAKIVDDTFKSKRQRLSAEEPTASSSSSAIPSTSKNAFPNIEIHEKVSCIKINENHLHNMVHSLDLIEVEHDDDTWQDCEEGSINEDICTCREYTDEEDNSSEDELPSRDVDLSSFTQIDSISDDLFQENAESGPKIPRKRKLTEHSLDHSLLQVDTPNCLRKRLTMSPRTNLLSPALMVTPKSACSGVSEKRTPRLVIPTKEHPPPEIMDWLVQFQRWTNAERIVALDKLIEQCEPTQVRYMMKVIEPQFQRDFISLLPKELALQVLSYLEPKDLLRAAQTCISWRFLADDNLLWKEKCKKAAIITDALDKPKRGRTGTMPPIASPWKAAYMRHQTIELNWRTNAIRSPKVLKGHDDHVITCLQFCGNRIVSGSDDNTLKLWSAVSGKCLRTLTGHTGGVWSSQMAGNIIISGSTDRTLKVWNADSGQCLHTLFGHTSTVRCMHLHGNKVVSGSRDATLRVWDISKGTCLHVLVGHLAAVRCVQYDGKFVVSGAYDYMVKVWNADRQECLHTLQGHTNRVYSLQFDGVHVVSGSLDTSIRVWEADTGACKHTLMGHQSLTSGMELKNNILVSGNADSTVKVWDILTGQCLQTLSGLNKHQSAVTCLQFNNRFVITSSDDGTVKLWDVKTGEYIRNLVSLDSGGSGGVVWRIRANDTKLICAVGSRNGTEETKLMVLDFDVEGACIKCS